MDKTGRETIFDNMRSIKLVETIKYRRQKDLFHKFATEWNEMKALRRVERVYPMATACPPTPAVYGKNFPTKPITELVIKNFPNPIPIMGITPQEYETNPFLRMRGVLRNMGRSEKLILVSNPFSNRLLRWLCGNSQYFSYSALSETYSKVVHEKIQEKVEFGFFTCPAIAKIEHGIYFFAWMEEFIDHEQKSNWIVFDMQDIKTHTQDEAKECIKKFLFSFSEKLRLIKTDEEIDRKEDTFDSIFLPDNIITDIREDIESFLKSRKIYKEELNLAWRRGYMLVGPPGNGKTLLVRKLYEYYGLNHFDIKTVIDNGGNISMDRAAENGLDYLLFPDEQKPQICVLEDIDKFTAFQSGEAERDLGSISLHSLLQGIDGVDQYDGIILIATTNFPDILHEAISGRPGRFDKIYNIGLPTPECIGKLLKYYKIKMADEEMTEVVTSLKGLSMAFVTEFVKSVKMKFKRNDITMEEAKVVLKAINDHRELCKKHFKDIKDIGFKKG